MQEIKDAGIGPPIDLDGIAAAASGLIRRWSGRQYGTRTDTFRPIKQGGLWRMIGLGGNWDLCRPWLDASAELYFTSRVEVVVSVTVDGAVLSPSLWQLYDHERLVRLDGYVWPIDQNLVLPSSARGTFEITATFGQPPPPEGVRAALVLGVELAKERTPGQTSRLPRGTTKVTRQGVSSTARSGTYLKDGFTGIWEIDSFLDAVNPNRLARRASVMSPDTIIPARRT